MTDSKSLPKISENRKHLSLFAGGVAVAWFIFCVVAYVIFTYDFGFKLLDLITCKSGRFFVWQGSGFLALTVLVGIVWPRRSLAAGLLGGYLILSTAWLLAAPLNAVFLFKLALFLTWIICAVNGVRRVILRFAGSNYATWGVAVAATYAALIPLCFFLGLFRLITPGIVGGLAIITALPGVVLDRKKLPTLPRVFAQWIGRLSIFDFCLLEVIWLALAVSFVGASTVEVRSDATRVHLPYIQRVVRDQGISHQYACWHRLQPMGLQTCCAVFYSLGSDAAAKWFCWLALPALALLAGEETRRRSGSERLGLLAGAALLACPAFVFYATTIYVLNTMALLCTAGFVVLFRGLRPPCLRGILLSAAIMAAMAQVKYTALVFCVVWGLVLFIGLISQRRWRVAALWSIGAGLFLAVVASPWYIYVYAGTGNPFYPYLQSWFPSPYWVDGFTLQQVFEKTFRLSPGISGALRFPWDVTFATNRFVENVDGYIGFMVLATAPCLLLVRPRNAGISWAMALAAVAMTVGIVSYTPYVRYWLPAYPLLLISCILAVGSLFRSRLNGGKAGFSGTAESDLPSTSRSVRKPNLFALRWSMISGVLLLVILSAPLPLVFAELSWDEYAGNISREKRLKSFYLGYQAVEQLNRILSSDEGVICTRFGGIHLISGHAVEYNFWWNKIHRIHNVETFADFCHRNRFRYWVTETSLTDKNKYVAAEEISAKYWTDERLVTGSGTVAIYDISDDPAQRWGESRQSDLPAVLDKTDKLWEASDTFDNWINIHQNCKACSVDDVILLSGCSSVIHRLQPEREDGLCKVKLKFTSHSLTHPLLEISWFDAEGKLLNRELGCAVGISDFDVWMFSSIPPGAKTGWLSLWEWQGSPIQVEQGTVTYWHPLDPLEKNNKTML